MILLAPVEETLLPCACAGPSPASRADSTGIILVRWSLVLDAAACLASWRYSGNGVKRLLVMPHGAGAGRPTHRDSQLCCCEQLRLTRAGWGMCARDEVGAGWSLPRRRAGDDALLVKVLAVGLDRPLHDLKPSTDEEWENRDSSSGSWNLCWLNNVSVRK